MSEQRTDAIDVLKMLSSVDLLSADGKKVPASQLRGKTIGLYFSAHWCPPCRMFTPRLRETFAKVNAAHDDAFRVIFVSMDNSEAEFREYFGEMPWLAVPFSNQKIRHQLANAVGVMGIPALTILASDGTILTKDGRGAVSSDPDGAQFPWTGHSSSVCSSCVVQ